MKVIIKKTIDKESKAVLFGYHHENNLRDGNTKRHFLDLTTDDSIKISIDEREDPEYIIGLLNDIYQNPVKIKKISLTSNKLTSASHYLKKFVMDANGSWAFADVIDIHLNPNQTEPWPIVLEESECKEKKLVLDFGTSYLFVLQPNEELTLDLVTEEIKLPNVVDLK